MRAIHPVENGACPRCATPGQAANTFCSECALRLGSGMLGVEPRSALMERGWLQQHPDVALKWEARLLSQAPDRVQREVADAAAAVEEEARRRREEATASFNYWAQRAAFLDHLMREARARLADAGRACEAAGVDAIELDAQLRRLTAPGISDHLDAAAPAVVAGPARARGRSSGGFFFFSESGWDMDGDGDVDGGLIDTVTQGVEDVAEAVGDAAEGVFGAIGDLFG